MPGKLEREVPYCTVCLVFSAIACHALVLSGNLATARTMNILGQSTGGWSRVGTQLGVSMSGELDETMSHVTSVLTDSMSNAIQVQAGIDSVLTLIGIAADGAIESVSTGNASGAALLEVHRRGQAWGSGHMKRRSKFSHAHLEHHGKVIHGLIHRAASRQPGSPSIPNVQIIVDMIGNLSQEIQNGTEPANLPQVRATIMTSLRTVTSRLMTVVTQLLSQFLDTIRPALLQVGQWLESFGDKIQAVIEGFSGSLDRVQKIFDQLMNSVSESGVGEEQMLYDTYSLFDASNTGFISVQDLRDVANMYGISALQGQKSEELFDTYDNDDDQRIREDEFARMVHDATLPNVMSTVLRSYASRLSTIAGQVGAARMRDEVARAVAEYFMLVCSKNQTKVSWVSQRLTNASVPMAFTADVLKQLATNSEDPANASPIDVGQTVMNEMVRQNHEYVEQVVDLLSQPSFWESEGFNPSEQADVVSRVTGWVAEAMQASLAQGDARRAVLSSMQGAARALVQRRLKEHRARRRAREATAAASLYVSHSGQRLLWTLLAGSPASTPASANPQLAQAINSGVPAVPETLEFARFLANNASSQADVYQRQCMDYSGESSSKLDLFANRIKSMVSRVQSFLNTMQTYSTPAGLARLESQVTSFGTGAVEDVLHSVECIVDTQLGGNGSLCAPGNVPDVPAQALLDLGRPGDSEEVVLNTVTTLNGVLTNLNGALPEVVDNVKHARREVSAVAAGLNSTFTTFEAKGPPIFQKISKLYATMWTAYFVFFTILTTSILFYGFWASGWCGGPQADAAYRYEAPTTWADRCRVCCTTCLSCMKSCSESHFTFWSCVIIMEIIVLILFLVSLVLCLLAGVKAFMVAGCSQVYLLGDDQICTGTLNRLRTWLTTFYVTGPVSLQEACNSETLLVCQQIGSALKKSTIFTIIGSGLGAVLSFQLIIESAVLHERARWRRAIDGEAKNP